jgi:hypothetical protein
METVISALGTLIVGIYLGFRIGFARGIRMNPRFPANPKPALSGWVLVGIRTGETVPVLYREGHAKSGRINSFWQLWGLPAILGIAGFVATSTGSIMLYWQRRKSRIPG